MTAPPLLDIEDLRVSFPSDGGAVEVVRGVSLTLGRERLGIVGESGSGKTLTGRAVLGLVPPPGRVTARRLAFDGIDLLSAGEKRLRALRGRRMAMVMQDPRFSLNPVMTVGRQIMEALRDFSPAQARRTALEALEAVRIRDPERVFSAYPHELSGGMGQRVMIAMMTAPGPDLLIADEPTSALDASVCAQVMEVLDERVRARGMGLLLISHDLELVASFCDRVLVMYAGRVVEEIAAARLADAVHPYTRGLLDAVPRIDRPRAELPVLARDPAWAGDGR
ncbi:MAG: ABC transporter ATP-binding protein [Alphaproteobacteria bacterium]|nr:ABC transporter ATP-binding protein [Alphaproteobacteria bacterium]